MTRRAGGVPRSVYEGVYRRKTVATPFFLLKPVMNRVPLTSTGHTRLVEELRNRKSKVRSEIVTAIATAREHGDLRENAEYHAACEQQSFNEGRIRELESLLSMAQVVDLARIHTDGRVVFASTVTLLRQSDGTKLRYQIVGEAEASVDDGRVSVSSPLARALIGKSAGEDAGVDTSNGIETYSIVSVEYC